MRSGRLFALVLAGLMVVVWVGCVHHPEHGTASGGSQAAGSGAGGTPAAAAAETATPQLAAEEPLLQTVASPVPAQAHPAVMSGDASEG